MTKASGIMIERFLKTLFCTLGNSLTSAEWRAEKCAVMLVSGLHFMEGPLAFLNTNLHEESDKKRDHCVLCVSEQHLQEGLMWFHGHKAQRSSEEED